MVSVVEKVLLSELVSVVCDRSAFPSGRQGKWQCQREVCAEGIKPPCFQEFPFFLQACFQELLEDGAPPRMSAARKL